MIDGIDVVFAMGVVAAVPAAVMLFVTIVAVARIRRIAARGRTVMMNMKPANQQEHDQQPNGRPHHRDVNGPSVMIRMRNQMKECCAQHQSADETHRQLEASVGHLEQGWNPTAKQRRGRDQRATEAELYIDPHRCMTRCWRKKRTQS